MIEKGKYWYRDENLSRYNGMFALTSGSFPIGISSQPPNGKGSIGEESTDDTTSLAASCATHSDDFLVRHDSGFERDRRV